MCHSKSSCHKNMTITSKVNLKTCVSKPYNPQSKNPVKRYFWFCKRLDDVALGRSLFHYFFLGGGGEGGGVGGSLFSDTKIRL